jgi:hypothetical protein
LSHRLVSSRFPCVVCAWNFDSRIEAAISFLLVLGS